MHVSQVRAWGGLICWQNRPRLLACLRAAPLCLPVCLPRPAACLFACRAPLLACLLATPLCLPAVLWVVSGQLTIPGPFPYPPQLLAAEAIEAARRLERLAEMSGGGNRVTLSSLASIDEDSDQQVQQRLSLILKADASGSVEAVRSALGALPQDAVLLRYLLAAPGEISTSDIDLAAASGGMVLGFNVTTSDAVQVRQGVCCCLGLGDSDLAPSELGASVQACCTQQCSCSGVLVGTQQAALPLPIPSQHALNPSHSTHPPIRPPPRPFLQAAAKRAGVELRTYSIIYDLIDDVRAAMEGRLKSGAWLLLLCGAVAAVPCSAAVPAHDAHCKHVAGSFCSTGNQCPCCSLMLARCQPHHMLRPAPLSSCPTVEERVSIGTAEVKAVFGSGNRKVAGCLVTDGYLRKDSIAVVKRGKRVVGEVRWVCCVGDCAVCGRVAYRMCCSPGPAQQHTSSACTHSPGHVLLRCLATAMSHALPTTPAVAHRPHPLPPSSPQGKLSSLRRIKDDVREVAAGTECGCAVEGFKDWEAGDKIECFELVTKSLKLEEAKAATVDFTGAEA